jgi:hypothetical protein
MFWLTNLSLSARRLPVKEGTLAARDEVESSSVSLRFSECGESTDEDRRTHWQPVSGRHSSGKTLLANPIAPLATSASFQVRVSSGRSSQPEMFNPIP